MADPTRSTFRHSMEFALFRTLRFLADRLPWRWARALGACAGRLFYHLDARHRRVTLANLEASDLGLDAAARVRLAKDVFAHFGSITLTTLKLVGATPQQLAAWIRVTGLEHWDAVQGAGKGFIVLTGHYGNWEGMGLGFNMTGRTLAGIGRELDNPLLERQLKLLRNRYGNEPIPKHGAMRDALRLFKRGGGVCFLQDQDALTSGIFVRFMGRWASTFPAAGTLAVKYGLPILPVWTCPEPDGTLCVQVEPPFTVPRTGDMDYDVWHATQLMTQCLERRVRREPRWWFWMHRRFKTQPGDPGVPPAGPESYWERFQATVRADQA